MKRNNREYKQNNKNKRLDKNMRRQHKSQKNLK